jgi:hypothetical protein
MTFSKIDQEKLKNIFKQAYREKEKLEISDRWMDGFIFRLRELEKTQSIPPLLPILAQSVWRLVPVTGLLILVLLAILLSLDFNHGFDAFQLLMNGKEEFALPQLFGL